MGTRTAPPPLTAPPSEPAQSNSWDEFVLACGFSVAAFIGWVLMSSLITNRQLLDAAMLATLVSMFVLLMISSVTESVIL